MDIEPNTGIIRQYERLDASSMEDGELYLRGETLDVWTKDDGHDMQSEVERLILGADAS